MQVETNVKAIHGGAGIRTPERSLEGIASVIRADGTADPAQDVTATLQASHDMHETFVAGIAH